VASHAGGMIGLVFSDPACVKNMQSPIVAILRPLVRALVSGHPTASVACGTVTAVPHAHASGMSPH
jgi:hypothetical protein